MWMSLVVCIYVFYVLTFMTFKCNPSVLSYWITAQCKGHRLLKKCDNSMSLGTSNIYETDKKYLDSEQYFLDYFKKNILEI